MTRREGCVFCAIAAHEEPANIRYEDDEVIIFDNKLTWVPLMLLAMPKSHMLQEDMWSDPIMGKVGKAAVDLGDQVSPGGYRLVSNIGRDAMQSQSHGHIHILGGMHLGPYA